MFHFFLSMADWCGFRIYALTMKNKKIVAFFCGVTIPQLALGIYLTVLGATSPGGSSLLPSIFTRR